MNNLGTPMDQLRLKALLRDCGLEFCNAPTHLRKAIEKFIGRVAQLLSEPDGVLLANANEIAELKRRLHKRQRRQSQQENAVPGRARGKARDHDDSREYFDYWSMRELHEKPAEIGRAKWLDTIKLNHKGNVLTVSERTHIRKILTTKMPNYVKARRKSKANAPPMFDHLLSHPDGTGVQE